MLPRNYIIAPPALMQKLTARNFNKKIECIVYCPNDEWYYVSKAGKLRQVDLQGRIWTSINDEMGWPTGKQRRVR